MKHHRFRNRVCIVLFLWKSPVSTMRSKLCQRKWARLSTIWCILLHPFQIISRFNFFLHPFCYAFRYNIKSRYIAKWINQKSQSDLFTPTFGKKNAGTRSFQDCVIEESNRCESISTDVMSESTILWMTFNRLCLNGARKMCQTLQIRKTRVQVIIKLGSSLLF